MQPLVITVPPNSTFTNVFWIQNLCGNILLLLDLQMNRCLTSAAAWFSPVWSQSVAGQDVAEAQ